MADVSGGITVDTDDLAVEVGAFEAQLTPTSFAHQPHIHTELPHTPVIAAAGVWFAQGDPIRHSELLATSVPQDGSHVDLAC